MFKLTITFDTLDEVRDFIANTQGFVITGPGVGQVLRTPDEKLKKAAPAEVVEVKTTPTPKKAAPAKKATKGTAAKKNAAQARAAAKLKQEEMKLETTGDEPMTQKIDAPKATKVDVADVQKALRAYAQQYQLTGARALLAQFGVAKASELKESQYADFVAAAARGPVTNEEA